MFSQHNMNDFKTVKSNCGQKSKFTNFNDFIFSAIKKFGQITGFLHDQPYSYRFPF